MIKPKRVWDSLQRTVRQGKKQVWDVNGEMKLNGGNKREEADSSQFQVYGKTYESPVEPFMTYDKGWSEEGGGGDERSLALNFSIDFYGEAEDPERQIDVTLYDDQQDPICTFSFLTNENTQETTFDTIGYGSSPLADKTYQQREAWETLCSDNPSSFLFNFGVLPMYNENDSTCPYNISMRGSLKDNENLYLYLNEYFSTLDYDNLFDLLSVINADGSTFVEIDRRSLLMDTENWDDARFDLVNTFDTNEGTDKVYFCRTTDGINSIEVKGYSWGSPVATAHGIFKMSYFYNNYEGTMENVFCHNFVIDQHPGEERWTLGDFVNFMFGKISIDIEDAKLGRVTDTYQEDVVGSMLLSPQQYYYESYVLSMYQTRLTNPFIYFKEDEYENSCTGTEGDYGEKSVVISWGTQGVGVEWFFDGMGIIAYAYGPIEGYDKFQEVINTLLDEYSVQDISSIFDLDNMTSSGSCAPMSTILSYLVLKGSGNVDNVVAWFRSAIEGGDKIIIWEEDPQEELEVSFDSIEGNGSYSIIYTDTSEEVYSGDTPDPIYVDSGASVSESGTVLTIGPYEITLVLNEGLLFEGWYDADENALPATITEPISISPLYNSSEE